MLRGSSCQGHPPKHTQSCPQRMRRGRQRPVLGSPEPLTPGLLLPLQDKGRKGEREHTLPSTTQPGLEQASGFPRERGHQGLPRKDSEGAVGTQGVLRSPHPAPRHKCLSSELSRSL